MEHRRGSSAGSNLWCAPCRTSLSPTTTSVAHSCSRTTEVGVREGEGTCSRLRSTRSFQEDHGRPSGFGALKLKYPTEPMSLVSAADSGGTAARADSTSGLGGKSLLLLQELCPSIAAAAPKDISEEQLLQILDAREKARAARDWNRADAIKDALSSTAGVEVYDKERCWTKADGTKGHFGGFGKGRCTLTDDDIAKLLRERQDARGARDFAKADAIKAELKEKGVETLDKEGIWIACDGRRGMYGSANTSAGRRNTSAPPQGGGGAPHGRGPAGFRQGGGFYQPPGLTHSQIELLVAQRERARRTKDFITAGVHAATGTWPFACGVSGVGRGGPLTCLILACC